MAQWRTLIYYTNFERASVNAPVALGYQKAKAKKSSSVLIMHTHTHVYARRVTDQEIRFVLGQVGDEVTIAIVNK